MDEWWENVDSVHDLRLTKSFEEFARTYFSNRHERSLKELEGAGEAHLEVYLEAWLLHGDAVELAGGDFATYLQAVVIIVADVRGRRCSGEVFESFARNPYGLLNIEADTPPCINRHFWNEVVFRRQLGQRPSS